MVEGSWVLTEIGTQVSEVAACVVVEMGFPVVVVVVGGLVIAGLAGGFGLEVGFGLTTGLAGGFCVGGLGLPVLTAGRGGVGRLVVVGGFPCGLVLLLLGLAVDGFGLAGVGLGLPVTREGLEAVLGGLMVLTGTCCGLELVLLLAGR